jgi:hypothetical protein
LLVLRKGLQIKSKIIIPVSLDEFDSFLIDKKDLLDTESERITRIIKHQIYFNTKNFDIKNVSYVYKNVTSRLDSVIEGRLKIEIQKLLLTNYDKELIDNKYDTLNERLFRKYSQVSKYQSINIRFFSSTDWKNLSVKALIEIFADYERTIKTDSLNGFKNLKDRYWILWNFVTEYTYLFESYFNEIEPTPIDWFENDFIQNTIKLIYKKEPKRASEYINQINDLLTVNPNISWVMTK